MVSEIATDLEVANAKKLKKITQWGDIKWSSFEHAFAECSNLDVNAADTPAFNDVNSTRRMFYSAENLKGSEYFNDWDVSSVTDMKEMFFGANAFNQPLNDWNVSSVTDMNSMFYYATAFNQSLNDWNVSSVTDMKKMFSLADAFNQPLNKWTVSSVTDMTSMFQYASSFTGQDLSSWDVDNVWSFHDYFMDGSGDRNIEPTWK
jgi:surface protein